MTHKEWENIKSSIIKASEKISGQSIETKRSTRSKLIMKASEQRKQQNGLEQDSVQIPKDYIHKVGMNEESKIIKQKHLMKRPHMKKNGCKN